MALWLWMACTKPAVVPAEGPYTLFYDDAAREVVLARRGERLLTLPLDGISLGLVGTIEAARSYDPFWSSDLADGGVNWRSATAASGAWPALSLDFDGQASGHLAVVPEGEGRFRIVLTPQDSTTPVAYVRLRAEGDPTEGMYGLGSALDTPNRRGRVHALQLEVDTTTEAFNNEAHVHVPLLIGTTGWGLFVRDDHPMTFAPGVHSDEQIEVIVGLGPEAPQGLVFELYAADHPLDVTARYWASTGNHRLPAPWAYGPWVWRDENTGQAEVEDDLRTMRDLDLAASGLWIDRPYATGVNTFDFEAAAYPDPQAMIDLAHAQGYRMALWHTPYVDEVEAQPLYDEAIANGYFPPTRPPVFIEWSSPIDFSNDEAYAWWQDLIGNYTAMGIEGYKLDYAEEVLVGAFGGRLPWQFANGADERTMHAEYQRLYHRVYAETLPADGGFLLVRTGAWGDQVNGPIVWPGDLDATLAEWAEPAVDRNGEAYVSVGGLPASLVNALSLGPSGFPFYGSDTGGYRHSPPDNETFVRWFLQTSLSSVMQIGTSTNDVAWQPTPENGFNEATLDAYREATRLHLRLWPYAWTYATAIGQGGGRPLMRPLGLAYPDLGVHPADSYLFGDHLLVAPVVRQGQTEREVIFPGGDWIHWFRGTHHTQGTEVVAAALHELPLFLAAGGIVPMLRPTIDTLSPVTDNAVDSFAADAGILYVRVFPGPAATFTLFDGSVVRQADQGDAIVLSFAGGDTFVAGAVFEIVGTDAPAGVSLDGAQLEQVEDVASGGFAVTEAVGGTVWVRVPPGATEVVLTR